MHAVMIINGKTVLNQPLDEWQQKRPEAVMEMLNPNSPHGSQPWSMPTVGILTAAALQNRDVIIHVNSDINGFIINTEYGS